LGISLGGQPVKHRQLEALKMTHQNEVKKMRKKLETSQKKAKELTAENLVE
jgi:hypothetical protein